MIERLENLPAGVDGVTAKGKITAQDYRETLWPLVESARQNGHHLRFLYHIAKDVDFTAGAALQDARLGLSGLGSVQRCAIVTDTAWIQNAVRFFATLTPCPMRVYGESDWDEATNWLAEVVKPDRIPHELSPEAGVLVMRPNKRIDKEDIESLDATVDAWLEVNGKLNSVVIHAARFPGWESLGSFFRHARLLRDRRSEVKRVAVVIDGTLPELASALAKRLVKAEVKHFAYDDYASAMDWVGSPPDTERSPGTRRGATSAEASP
jgi:hypothetical protein